jgi:hypothetical protein
MLALVLACWIAGACGPVDDHLVTGMYGNSKVIGLSYYEPTNTEVEVVIIGYADVAPGTPARFSLSGPQQWTCDVVFEAPSGGALTNGDGRHDKVVTLPRFGFTLVGPHGEAWDMSIDIPDVGAAFRHTYVLGSSDPGADFLYAPDPRCSQVALTLAQQRNFAASYLNDLKNREISTLARVSGAGAVKVQGLLEQAESAKTAGDTETDAGVRAGFYRTAAASLMAITDFVAAMPGLATNDSARIAAYARNAAAILLQTDLR